VLRVCVQVGVLSMVNPLVLLPTVLSRYMIWAGKKLVRDDNAPLWLRVAVGVPTVLVLGIPFVISALVLKGMGLDGGSSSSSTLFNRMAVLMLLPVYFALCGVTGAWGLAGTTTAIVFVAIGAVSISVSVDRALWLVWWAVVLLAALSKLENSLTAGKCVFAVRMYVQTVYVL